MDPLDQVGLSSIMSISSGNPDVKIGLIDGPLEYTHADFQGSRIRAIKESQLAACRNASSVACKHCTFVAGILCAKRGSSAPAICPGCTLLLRPVFIEEPQRTDNKGANEALIFPSTTAEELSDAIIEVVDGGARVINLSLGLSTSSLITYPILQEAYDYACQHETILLAASGNQGNIGGISLLNNKWIVPVAACNENGLIDPISNLSSSIGIRGLMAPGVSITSTSSGGGYLQMSGTSFAVPFVTGTLALLWSIFPNTTAAQVLYAIRKAAASANNRGRSIVPPLLNAEKTLRLLEKSIG